VFKRIDLMKITLLIPFLLLLACKTDQATANNNSTENNEAAIGSQKIGEPVMGGPTNVNIKLNDYPSNGLARIIGFYADQNFLVDTVPFKNGTISYKNTKGLPQGLYYFNVKGREEYIQVVLGQDQEFDLALSLKDIANTMVATGSDENKIFYENMKYESTINPLLTDVVNKMKALQEGSPEYNLLKQSKDEMENQKIETIKTLKKQYPSLLFPVFKLAGQNPIIKDKLPKERQVPQYRIDFWDFVDINDTRLLRTPVIGNKVKRFFKELVPQHHDSLLRAADYLISRSQKNPELFQFVANYVVMNYEPGKSTLMDAESVFVGMAKKYFTKEKAFWSDSMNIFAIQQRASEMEASLLGKKAPNVISTDNFGKKQELLAKTADYIVVYMYNPECEHCMEQSPKLVKFYNENKAKGIDVFAIAVETDETKWKNYITKTGMTFTNVFDPTNRSIYGKYFVDVTPEIYVINKQRVLIGKNLKVDQIQFVIDKDKNGGKAQ
jgi:peroxiredoxin